MIYNFVVAFTFLLVATFSYWYSSKLTVYRESSFVKSFFVVVVSYTIAGVLKLLTQNLISYYSIAVMFIVLFTVQTFLANYIFKESYKKGLLTALLSFVVTIIIGLPLLVLSGIAISYLKLPNN
ncbi:MAG: competence protein comp [Hydrogenothermaceae bacterium]|nr:competence protein comp [Hydrogenothermaceae bacterium]